MHWLFSSWRKLKELGILGINKRNAALILDHNPRSLYPLVDDKLRMRDLCREIRVPTPEIYASLDSHSSLRRLDQLLKDREEFVVKPNRGSAGRGVLVIVGPALSSHPVPPSETGRGKRDGPGFRRHNHEILSWDNLRQHSSDVL